MHHMGMANIVRLLSKAPKVCCTSCCACVQESRDGSTALHILTAGFRLNLSIGKIPVSSGVTDTCCLHCHDLQRNGKLVLKNSPARAQNAECRRLNNHPSMITKASVWGVQCCQLRHRRNLCGHCASELVTLQHPVKTGHCAESYE